MYYNLTPMGKPRMTQSDKWKKRKCVVEYWAFKDEIREKGVEVFEESQVIFYLPMPASWSDKKKAEHHLKPHKTKPDLDNMLKGLWDACFVDDAHLWRIAAEKRWAYEGGIEILPLAI